MRVLITKTLMGSIDGMQLSRLLKGRVYDVYTSLACYLLSEGVAEPVMNDEPAGAVPAQKKVFEHAITIPRSVAADRTRKKKPKKT